MSSLKLQRFETCDYALTAQDGKLSIMGIFDRIFVQNLPAQHPTMTIVVVAQGEPKSDHAMKIEIKNPSGGKINEFTMHVKTNESGFVNLIANLNNLPITEQGIMKIECFDGETKVGTKELVVSKVPQMTGSKAKN